MSAPVGLAAAEQHVQEQAARAFRLGELYEEEGHGLLWALNNRTSLQWSSDPEKQARFLKGFNDGCEILRLARGESPSPTEAA